MQKLILLHFKIKNCFGSTTHQFMQITNENARQQRDRVKADSKAPFQQHARPDIINSVWGLRRNRQLSQEEQRSSQATIRFLIET